MQGNDLVAPRLVNTTTSIKNNKETFIKRRLILHDNALKTTERNRHVSSFIFKQAVCVHSSVNLERLF